MHFTFAASVALALGLAGQAAAAKTPVSQAVFDKFTRYTSFSAASYADSCRVPPYGSTVVSYFSDTASDAQATLFRSDSAREIIIAFRGTSTPADFTTDLTFPLTALTAAGTSCSGCQVHTGFQKSYTVLSAAVLSAIRAQKSAYPSYSLTVTGHSLGGAMASIAASSFVASGLSVAAVYTFGEPYNGNAAFATYINSQIPPANYYRVTHANDGVPQIPPPLLGFAHHGTEYWESAATGSVNSPATTFQCTDADAKNCNQAQFGGFNPINGAHISYTNQVIGNSLYIQQCGDGPNNTS